MNNLGLTKIESARSNLYEEKKIFDDFYNQLDAIKSFVDSINHILITEYDFMNEKKEDTLVNLYIYSQIKEKLVESGINREELQEVFDHLSKENTRIFRKENSSEDILAGLKEFLINEKTFGESNIIVMNEREDGKVNMAVPTKITEIYLKEYIEKIDKNRIHKELLYKSSFISMVVAFEMLINNILYHRAYNNPKSIGIENKILKFEEILNIGSTEELINYLIEEHVTDIMKKSFQEWMKHLKKELKLEVNSNVKNLEEDLIEVFQRRNIMVHAGGVVNNIYIKNVSEKHRNSLVLGDKIDISIEYIDKTIDLMKVFGANLFYNYWCSSEKKSDIRDSYFDDIAFQELKNEKYIVARNIYKLIMPKASNISDEYRYKINYWQTFKWANEFDKIKNEIENFDLSAANIEFQLMKDLLLDNFQDAFPKFVRLIDSGDWELYMVSNWPIFKEFMKQEMIMEYINNK